jgi:hypothetical protein
VICRTDDHRELRGGRKGIQSWKDLALGETGCC